MRYAILILLLSCVPAMATECPKDAKACKVVVLTDDQIATLELLLENTCLSGPYNQIKQAVSFYTDLMEKAPAGDVAKPNKTDDK